MQNDSFENNQTEQNEQKEQNKKDKNDKKDQKTKDTKEKKLNILKKKRDQLKARIQSLEAAEKTKERKKDTRRKILIGAFYLDQTRANGSWNAYSHHREHSFARS